MHKICEFCTLHTKFSICNTPTTSALTFYAFIHRNILELLKDACHLTKSTVACPPPQQFNPACPKWANGHPLGTGAAGGSAAQRPPHPPGLLSCDARPRRVPTNAAGAAWRNLRNVWAAGGWAASPGRAWERASTLFGWMPRGTPRSLLGAGAAPGGREASVGMGGGICDEQTRVRHGAWVQAPVRPPAPSGPAPQLFAFSTQ